jgi:DNA excision repair protein ERCC-2
LNLALRLPGDFVTVQIDSATKTITLSVRDFCDAEATGGSLNLSPLADVRSQMGRSIHADFQAGEAQERSAYRKEQTLRFDLRYGEYRVTIHGRIDGLYEVDGKTVVQEIKSVLSLSDDLQKQQIPTMYGLQLKIYLYLWMQLYPGVEVTGHLILISCEPEKVLKIIVAPDTALVSTLILERLKGIVEEYESDCQRQKIKEAKAEAIPFPFPKMRKNQDRMIEAIETALQDGRPLLISAPAGVGKTVAALYATLRFAAKNRLSVFFLTSKTTQQRIVADTLRLWSQGLQNSEDSPPVFNSLILRAKEKICANDVVFCHESRCPYAKDFFQKLNSSNVRSTLIREPLITPERIYANALKQELCPFELSLEMLNQVDLTVCDYNYIYDPRIAIQRLTKKDESRTIVVIDEAHNLYSRAREYYSPSLDLGQIQSLRRSIQLTLNSGGAQPALTLDPSAESHPSSFLSEFERFLKRLEEHFQEIAEAYTEVGESNQAVVSMDKEFFSTVRDELDQLMKRYLIYQRRAGYVGDEDQIVRFCYALSDFCRVLELTGDEFVHVFAADNHSAQLKIVCLSPAPQLRRRHQCFYAVIGMSATLSPMEFYRDILGFERDTQLLDLPSPFPPEKRKILVIPEVSTTYGQRARHFPRIAQIIEEVAAIRPGNYFAFFPSFEFLKGVASQLNPSHSEMLIQHSVMSDDQRSALLERLADRGKPHLVLAVQGGIFAEGVDYPGELAIGAIIVGPGLPKVSFEVELMRRYYEENYEKGFEYAYLYPAMNRVVQSAGRIIRSETDHGVIVLLDKRFAYENYSRLFPRDWYESSPAELLTKDYSRALADFWNST